MEASGMETDIVGISQRVQEQSSEEDRHTRRLPKLFLAKY
jgi:hypothetical protein